MADQDAPVSPTDQLAERLKRRLLEEELLKEDQMGKLYPKNKNGKAKPEDWKIAIDLSTKAKVKR